MPQHPSPTALAGPAFDPASGEAPSALIVLLHGVGADGNDLIGLAPYLAAQLPEARFVSPDGPEPYDMAPFGRQWFSLRDRSAAALAQGAESARAAVDSFIESECARLGLAANRVALLGFSQGAMMALHAGLRRTEPLAAIAAFSGRLMGAEMLASEIRSRPPVLLVHGDADPVVTFEASVEAEQALAGVNIPVSLMIRPNLGHSLDAEGIQAAIDLFKVNLGLTG